MESRKLMFTNDDGQELAARLDLPVDADPRAYALFAHCFTCSKNLKAVANISRALTSRHIGVLRFDFTGLGESEGDFADTNFSSNVADLVCAADYLAKEMSAAPKILIGHSLGGAAVLQAAGKIDSCEVVATIGAPCNPSHVTRLLESKRDEIEERGEAEVRLGGRKFRIKKQFLDDLEMSTMTRTIRELKRPILIFHSPVDNIVGVENAAHIFESALHPKSFISLDKADHLLSEESDSDYVGAVIAAWASKYIDLDLWTAEREKPAVESGRDSVMVRTEKDHYYTEVMAQGHFLIADEPESSGGTNRGPSPYALLMASLGACSTITVRMYADRKEWPLESVNIRLEHKKIPAEECDHCETKSGKIDYFKREISFTGPLDDAQRERLLQIADKCPVHRTLHNEVWIETVLGKED